MTDRGTPVALLKAALRREEEELSGAIRPDAVFFGWLATISVVILLSALAGVIGAVLEVPEHTDLAWALKNPAANRNNGLIGGIIMLAVLMLSYYAGGYLAGRMAGSSGLKQGFALWIWAFAGSALQICLALAVGLNILLEVNAWLPLLPQQMDGFIRGRWIAVPAGLTVTLVGACLGGFVGVRAQRRVERAANLG